MPHQERVTLRKGMECVTIKGWLEKTIIILTGRLVAEMLMDGGGQRRITPQLTQLEKVQLMAVSVQA